MPAAATMEQEEHLVAFRLAGHTYGVPVMLVQEIIRPCEITPFPGSPESVLGIVNLRGKDVPVIDLRRRLDLPAAEETGATRIVVIEVKQGAVAMMVDGVTQVVRLPAAHVEPGAELFADVNSGLVIGVGKLEDGSVILLDIPKVLGFDGWSLQDRLISQAA